MTEEEARTKWCPMTRKDEDGNYNGWNEFGCCVASDCMMWRWSMTPETAKAYNDNERGKPYCAEGYCGLGGKP